MNIRLRFLSFFTVGLIGFVLYMGFVMTALFNLILPFFNVSTEHDFIAFIIVFAFFL